MPQNKQQDIVDGGTYFNNVQITLVKMFIVLSLVKFRSINRNRFRPVQHFIMSARRVKSKSIVEKFLLVLCIIIFCNDLICLGHVTKIELELEEAPDDSIPVGSVPPELDVTAEINSTYPDGELKIWQNPGDYTSPLLLFRNFRIGLQFYPFRYFKRRNVKKFKRRLFFQSLFRFQFIVLYWSTV